MNTRLSHGAVLTIFLSCAAVGCGTEAQRGDSAGSQQSKPAQPPATSTPQAKPGDAPANADALVLKDFKHRIDAYMKLRGREERGKAEPKETSDPEKIKATQDLLAEKITAARKDAKPGDIFTPEIRELFRRLMYPEMKGPDAKVTKEAIKLEEAAPTKGQVLKVNARYPEASALPTVPPNLLARLPQLPEELEYRIVRKDLILRDVNANLIVDYIPNAIR